MDQTRSRAIDAPAPYDDIYFLHEPAAFEPSAMCVSTRDC